jgi:hypothetical protein
MWGFAAIASLSLTAACARPDEAMTLHVTETRTELAIVGVDRAGGELARLSVRTGRIVLEDDGRIVDGRELDVVVDGETVRHQSERSQPVELPLIPDAGNPRFNAFLLDRRVREALARWEIGIDDRRAPIPTNESILPSETSYESCNWYPTCQAAMTGTLNCAQRNRIENDSSGFCTAILSEQMVCCQGAQQTANQRQCGYGAAGLSNPCGPEGSAGCALCWSVPWTSYCNATSGGAAWSYCWEGGERLGLESTTISISYQ